MYVCVERERERQEGIEETQREAEKWRDTETERDRFILSNWLLQF